MSDLPGLYCISFRFRVIFIFNKKSLNAQHCKTVKSLTNNIFWVNMLFYDLLIISTKRRRLVAWWNKICTFKINLFLFKMLVYQLFPQNVILTWPKRNEKEEKHCKCKYGGKDMVGCIFWDYACLMNKEIVQLFKQQS